ncbi:MAG: imidazole glycerol phosphate synthase subunit HisH [Bacteroidetes bacterium]|nr:imidazole glycerol phosphate synthase subunit HisH [Bacteroidota bacterium]
MKVAIIKYNAGNIQSVTFALERLGITPVITDNSEEIQQADKVIFPGVGEASSAMKYLKNANLDQVICSLKQPTLGICLGMQLMCKHTEEGNAECLGIFDSTVKLFNKENNLKVPQIGWNTIFNYRSELFKGIKEKEYMYFVHSYYVEKYQETIATTNYGVEYSSAIQKNNFYAVQFHPEKSSEAGQTLLSNFLNI